MMIAGIDTSMPWPVAHSLGHAVTFPLWLALTAKLPLMRERHALRFFCSAVISLIAWAASLILYSETNDILDLLTGLMVMGGFMVFYLQVWGLITRGYTIGILLTLFKSGRPLTDREIFDGYRDGDGLNWIMRHRIGDLSAAGFVLLQGDTLILASRRGVLVARLQRLCVSILGLRRTG